MDHHPLVGTTGPVHYLQDFLHQRNTYLGFFFYIRMDYESSNPDIVSCSFYIAVVPL